MKREDYITYDAVTIANLIRNGEITPLEVLRCCTDLIDDIDPEINAIYYKAYNEAEDVIKKGINLNAPFSGVPILVKDSGGMVKGFPYSAGSRLIEGCVCQRDTGFVKRLKQAGFVIVGSTKTPECCFTNTTESILHGKTRNPWNLLYSTGGSSGGSAAAVASRMVPFAHGSDGGGSIREPSACCGVVGYKPSRFRITGAPACDDSLNGFSINFGIARSVRDISMILRSTEGLDPGYYGSLPALDSYKIPKTLRVAVLNRYPLGGEIESAEINECLETMVRSLRNLGHTVSYDAPVINKNIHWARTTIQSVYIVDQLETASKETGKPINEDYVEKMILETYEKGKKVTGSDFILALKINNDICRSVGQFMTDYDVILCPTIGETAPLLGETDQNDHPEWTYDEWTEKKSRYTHFTNPFNTTGQPSISLPVYVSHEGLPIGIELSGRIGEDVLVLELASQIEKMFPWKDRIPEVTKKHIHPVF